jgi:predicted metal-dependent enzyme (double-stranded beta helix superfamily)
MEHTEAAQGLERSIGDIDMRHRARTQTAYAWAIWFVGLPGGASYIERSPPDPRGQSRTEDPMTIQRQRDIAVATTLAEVRALVSRETARRELGRATLERVATVLNRLASRRDLFSLEHFPPPADGEGTSTRYRLSERGDEPALYLNAIVPGKKTIPHNHDTWAVIAAVHGQEWNRVYRRTDDGSDPLHATLEVEREQIVEPGSPIAFLAADFHSIHVVGDAPTLHFHLYGRPLETLTARVGVEPATGRIVNYNATQLTPEAQARPKVAVQPEAAAEDAAA